jgi:hypothetical protein
MLSTLHSEVARAAQKSRSEMRIEGEEAGEAA